MRTRSAPNAEPARGAKRATGFKALPDELLARVLVHLPSIRDFGRANCVCRAWHARGSPVEQALRERIEARSEVMPAPVAGCSTYRMCWLELVRQMRAASGRISANEGLGAAVDKQGRLRMWGEPSGMVDDLPAGVVGDHALTPGGKIFKYGHPTVLPQLKHTRVECVSVGPHHVLVLTDTGAVLSLGYGNAGLLGHGDMDDQRVPKVIEALRDVRVVAIAAGGVHSMALTDEGAVLSFGHGKHGQLGHGDEEDLLVPKVIEALRGVRVVAIVAGLDHSMVLTDEGIVLSFGLGEFGQLGHGDRNHQLAPKVIEALRDRRVVSLATGSVYSMVLTDAGAVLSFGDGWHGQLGNHGDVMEQAEPKAMVAFSGRRVVAIAAGGCNDYGVKMNLLVQVDEGSVRLQFRPMRRPQHC